MSADVELDNVSVEIRAVISDNKAEVLFHMTHRMIANTAVMTRTAAMATPSRYV